MCIRDRNERVVALTTTLDLENDGREYGKISEKVLSLTTSFDYVGEDGSKIATAKKKLISWGVEVDVVDCNDTLIGSIEEEVFESLLKTLTVYRILDASGVEIARSKKVDLFATSFTLRDSSGNIIASLKRPAINFLGNNWTVDIMDSEKIDPRLLVMIGACLLYTSPSPRDATLSRMPSSA